MLLIKSILILEDNLKVLSKILDRLYVLEGDQPFEFSVMALTTSLQVEEYINSNPKANFDIILLDRDCKIDGSFHVLDIERFGKKKIISISAVPEYNNEARLRGVKRIVPKDIVDFDKFANTVVKEINDMISKVPLI